MHSKELKIGIVCGCLPNQAGINEEDLYHQLVKQKISLTLKQDIYISSIWYTTLAESNAKLSELIENETPEIILYHVRPDPFLRIVKFIIKYKNEKGEIVFLKNLKADDTKIKEKNYIQILNTERPKKASYKVIFRSLNYMAGYVFGVYKKAVAKEIAVIEETIKICLERNKQLIIIGPASRPRSFIENKLLNKLEKRLYFYFRKKNVKYITCFGTEDENKNKLFMADGVHVSKAGHVRIANLIQSHIEKWQF